MKKIAILVICVCISCTLLIEYVLSCNAEGLNIEEHTFKYYSVPNQVFDTFIENVGNIEFLKENSEYVSVESSMPFCYSTFNSSAILNMGVPDYLANSQNVYETLYSSGIKSEIYDYIFFATPYLGDEFFMPMSVWLNTASGIKFATIERGGEGSNFFNVFKLEILEPYEYINRFSLKRANTTILGVAKTFDYSVIRNKGANIGLRELMETLGINVIWNELDNSISLMCPENVNPQNGINLKFDMYLPKNELYTVTATLIKPGSSRNGKDLTSDIAWHSMYGACVLRMKDDRTIVDNFIAEELINMLLLTTDSGNNFYSLIVDTSDNTIKLYYDDK